MSEDPVPLSLDSSSRSDDVNHEIEHGAPASAPLSHAAQRNFDEYCNVPYLSLWELFRLFFSFGLQAWGGPIAQIAMMKAALVENAHWISVNRFNRVLAVYQALPGPEATEFCCYFGMLSRGRKGSFVCGVAFIIPGFVLMLAFAIFYKIWGMHNSLLQASFIAMQCATTAMIFRALHRIAEHAFVEQDNPAAPFSMAVFLIGGLGALLTVMRVNIFLTLFVCGVCCLFQRQRKHFFLLGFLILFLIAYLSYAVLHGLSANATMATGVSDKNTLWNVFVHGLLGGLLTFGGAYTAIPFIQQDVVSGGWMTLSAFIDGIAIGSVLPTPTVMFVTFVGYMAQGIWGALLMTLGMFLPAFSFTMIGHEFFERIIDSPKVSAFLDGVTAAVVGTVTLTALDFVRLLVNDTMRLFVFATAIAALYGFKHKMLGLIVITGAAIAGQVLFTPR